MDTDYKIADDFLTQHPVSAAQVLDKLADDEVAEFIQELSIEKSLGLLNLMNNDKAAKCFSLLPSELAKELMESGDLHLMESLCRQFDEPFRNRLLAKISPQKAASIRQKLEQIPNTVGMLMVPVTAVNKEMTVKTALEKTRQNKGNLGSYLYVIDAQGIFEGAVNLEELLFADRNMILADLLLTTIPKFYSDTPIKNILDDTVWHDYRLIPVVDRSEKLLGALPYAATKVVANKKSGQLTKEILETSSALGELYRIGLTGFFQSMGR